MAFIAKTLAVVAFGLGLHVSATGSRGGSLDFYSDDKCEDLLVAETAPIPLDVCMVSSPLGHITKSFRVKQKPYCPDGSRPSLLFFQDCACTDGVANWIPNADYGDYGNGSCQAGWGGDFLMFVLSCGEFQEPVRSVISFAATFPSTATTTKQVGCPALDNAAPATTGPPDASSSSSSEVDFWGWDSTATGRSEVFPSIHPGAAPQPSAANASSSPAPTATGTRSTATQATNTQSQTTTTTSSAAIRRYEMWALYWMGYAGVFGAVSYLLL